jgi:hypothetical protein
MDTPEGKAAKREVERLISAAQSVTIYTSKADKYDRYLADVFLIGVADEKLKGVAGVGEPGPGSATPATTMREAPIFLNNHLLENGFAERKDAWQFGDWNF